jgi:hypothetical protein
MSEGSSAQQDFINNIVNAVAYAVQHVLATYGVQAISNAVVSAVTTAVQNVLQNVPKAQVSDWAVNDATALLAETPDEIDASELPKYVSDAVALHSEDFVDLVGFNRAVNSYVYDTAFKGVVVKPANYEKSRARFLTLHDAYPYLEIDVNGYKIHILARRVAIKTKDATPPYNVRSYLVLEVSVTKPKEKQKQNEEKEREQEQGEEETEEYPVEKG